MKANPIVQFVRDTLDYLRALLETLAMLFGGRLSRRKRIARPWHIRIRPTIQFVHATDSELNDLVQRLRLLEDLDKLAQKAASFRLPENDFFADPAQIERFIRRLLEQNPPWLYFSRTLSGAERGAEKRDQEILWREQVTTDVQDVTLYIPDENWRDKPLSSLTMRQARQMNEAWQARLLEQVLPPELLLDRIARGEVLIPVRHTQKRRLDFHPEQRRIRTETRKPVAIPIEMEGGDSDGGQLLYILLDYSASMRGKNATLALAVIATVLRANMGRRDTRYLFRRYAEEENIYPREVEPPIQARTLAEKDAFLDTILATNFNGGATHVNSALQVAAADIEHLRRHEQLEAGILLVTDGRAEILPSTRQRIADARIRVHTILVSNEPNPDLEALSESFTLLDIHPEQLRSAPAEVPLAPRPQPRRAFRI